jgi:hypothetical protein
MAPQHPALGSIRVWMPAASSTRAVARLMLGSRAGCTQPASSSTRRSRRAPGPARRISPPARRAAAAWPAAPQAAWGAPPAETHGRSKPARTQPSAQQPAQRRLAARSRHALLDQAPADVDQAAVFHAGRAGGFAVATGQAAIQVLLGHARRRLSLEHLLDQVDAPARTVELVAQQLIGRAGRQAKPAVHALAQDGLGLDAQAGAFELAAQFRLHVVGGKFGGAALSQSQE